MTLTREEARDLVVTLLVWEREVGPCPDDHETGLNNERYILLMQKLIDELKGSSPVPQPDFDYNKKHLDNGTVEWIKQ